MLQVQSLNKLNYYRQLPTFFLVFSSRAPRVNQRNCRFQLNAPQCNSKLFTYEKVSSFIMSITGHTTVFLSFFTTTRRASSHPAVHSQWASRKVKTSPLAAAAPFNLALTSPTLFWVLKTVALTGSFETCSSKGFLRKSKTDLFVFGAQMVGKDHIQTPVAGIVY